MSLLLSVLMWMHSVLFYFDCLCCQFSGTTVVFFGCNLRAFSYVCIHPIIRLKYVLRANLTSNQRKDSENSALTVIGSIMGNVHKNKEEFLFLQLSFRGHRVKNRQMWLAASPGTSLIFFFFLQTLVEWVGHTLEICSPVTRPFSFNAQKPLRNYSADTL